MIRLVVISIAFALVFPAADALARKVHLDAPVSRVRTMRSEIRRGNTDAFDCLLEMIDKTSANDYANCVMDKITTDGYNASSSKAYLFGVYASAIERMRPMLAPSIARLHSPAEYDMAVEAEANWKAQLRAAISATRLTRGDLCDAIGAENMARCKSDPL